MARIEGPLDFHVEGLAGSQKGAALLPNPVAKENELSRVLQGKCALPALPFECSGKTVGVELQAN